MFEKVAGLSLFDRPKPPLFMASPNIKWGEMSPFDNTCSYSRGYFCLHRLSYLRLLHTKFDIYVFIQATYEKYIYV